MAFGVIKGGKAVLSGGWKAFGSLGSHSRGILVGSGLAYGGWKWVSTGHIPGEGILNTGVEILEKSGNVVSNGLDAVDKGLEYVNDGLDRAPELIHDTKEALVGGGVGDTGQSGGLLGNLFGGFSNLFGGLFSGGTGSMLGLAASAFLLFGGFGWMGKIGGILLAALSLGLFSNNNQQQQVQVAQQQVAQQQVPIAAVQSRQENILPSVDTSGEEESGYTVHRGRSI